MKKIKLIVLLIMLFITSGLVTQTKSGASFNFGTLDSLIFDDSNGNTDYFNMREECNMKVIKVHGTVYGTILTSKIENTCGEIDTVYKLTYGEVKTGDILASEAFVRTKDFSHVELEISDGKSVWLGPGTEFKMGREYCMGNGTAYLYEGTVYISGGKSGNTSFKAGHSLVKITNTKFSIETLKDGDVTTDILRVYEGSVIFGLDLQNSENTKKTEDKGSEIVKLTEDLQNGKLSIQEYSSKVQELQKEMTDNQFQITRTVNAGYESRSVGAGNIPTEPVLFDINENRWWEK